ncbi:MAG: selenium cofactor biosynthesis protein YqeC [Cetobacterium sp.]|nr:selenium cofactor biosynthesis protein YqeC [Cetobacterium sp.]
MINYLDLKKGDILAITGSSGKTTLLFYLAQKLKKFGKVLVTTTTKIYIPDKKNYDLMFIGDMDFNKIENNSITVYGHSLENNKIIGWNPSFLKTISKHFDYILIEADGSMGKPLKGWKENEPQIPLFVNKTIGLLNPKSLYENIDENIIHRLPLFNEQFNKNNEKIISEDIFSNYINSNLLFKNSTGERFFFFNQVEDFKTFKKFFTIANKIDINGKILWGSLFNEEFYTYKKITGAILAGGFSKRMGEDKLNILLPNQKSILENTILALRDIPLDNKFLITRDNKFKELCKKYYLRFFDNKLAHLGQSEGVKLAINNCDSDGIIFIPGDMPLLETDTILKLIYEFEKSGKIVASSINNEICAPIIFPMKYKEEFNNLTGDTGGRKLLSLYPYSTINFENQLEFLDVDTQEELQKIRNLHNIWRNRK